MAVDQTSPPSFRQSWVAYLSVLLAYVLAAQAGLLLDMPGTVGSPFWPASGVALAALVLVGWGALPLIAVGSVIVNGANFAPLPLMTLALDAAGAVIEPVIAVTIARRLAAETPFSFATSKGVLATWVACLLATATSTALGIFGFVVSGKLDVSTLQISALTWWVGNSAGALVVGPLVLAWARSSFSGISGRFIEAVILLLMLPMLGGLAYGAGLVHHGHGIVILEALGVPAVLIAAYRFKIAGTVIAAAATTCAAIAMAMVALSQGGDREILNDALMRLQFYVVVVTLGGHLLASEVAIRTSTEMALRGALARETEANAAKTIFLAKMSHELRTPLNAILGFSEVIYTKALGDTPESDVQYNAYAVDIHASGRHLLSLIDDILDVSRIETETYTVEKEILDAARLIEECMGMIRARAAARQTLVRTEIDGGLPPLHADPRAARQILINLLTNAVKFTPENGVITVSARASQDNGLIVTVADTGIGIPADALGKVFEPFRRFHSHLHSPAIEGTGLGLAISKGLIDLHGGTITIASTPGKGTIVEIGFPPRFSLQTKGTKAVKPISA